MTQEATITKARAVLLVLTPLADARVVQDDCALRCVPHEGDPLPSLENRVVYL